MTSSTQFIHDRSRHQTQILCAKCRLLRSSEQPGQNEISEWINRQLKHRSPIFLHTCRFYSPKSPNILSLHSCYQSLFTLYDGRIQSKFVNSFSYAVKLMLRRDVIVLMVVNLCVSLDSLITILKVHKFENGGQGVKNQQKRVS